jgi:hypothetical protein
MFCSSAGDTIIMDKRSVWSLFGGDEMQAKTLEAGDERSIWWIRAT